MIGQHKLETLLGVNELLPVAPGRLMVDFADPQGYSFDSSPRTLISRDGREAALRLLDQAGVRGRSGSGFPAGLKWWLVSSAEATEKFFICNGNFSRPGSAKESWFMLTNPARLVEATAIAAFCVGAHQGFITLPESAHEEFSALDSAIRLAHDAGILGRGAFSSGWELDIKLIRTPDAYLAGEETALLEFIEGKPLQPRGKPPLPTSSGLFGKPTAVNNLETVLQCYYALKVGPDVYRQVGTAQSPGTLVFTLGGRVKRPGIYELPLGTTLRDLVFRCGRGMEDSVKFKAAFPGGVGSAVLGQEQLDIGLDFDSVLDAGSALRSGMVIALGENDCAVEVARSVATFFHQGSCGKCMPCKDGTARTLTMLMRLDEIETPNVDIPNQGLPPSKRQPQLTILNNGPSAISYTDNAKGLDKIAHLCEFFQFRGDCHHPTQAASSVMSLLNTFRDEFEEHTKYGDCALCAKRRTSLAEAG